MKIVTWNTGYWQHTKFHHQAWEYLRNVIQPDLALLQETKPPDLSSSENIVFVETFRGWGADIYSRGLSLSSLDYETEYFGRVAMARVSNTNSLHFDTACIHAPIIKNRVFPHLEKIVVEIEECVGQRTAIIGGDFNSARLAEVVWPGYGHGPFFDRMDKSRFVNCCWEIHGKELQTYFRKDLVNPFQDDHIFISGDLFPKLANCEIIENEEIKQYSDHIPLMIELDFAQID